jgi:two-component system, OmpR family, heavy metal sensor histidine kinase CusS
VASLVALGSDWRAAQVAEAGGKGVMAADLAAIRNTLNGELVSIAWRAAPLALLLTGLGAWLMSALAMRPVARLQDTMEAVDQQSLEQRLPSEREDREFQALIGAYNRMLDRLEASFRQAMRFSADAAHELRTPLTILQGQIEELMRQSADLPTQVRLAQMLDEAIRLSTITRKLLLLSQADAGRLALLLTPMDLQALLQERLDDAKASLPGIKITSDFAGNSVVPADPPLMDQLFNNLCGNACSYTPEGGWIGVRLRGHDNGVEVVWSNSCLPLLPSSRDRLFERFYRGDPAHGRKIDGHGLGLSISREIARAHGGDLTLLAGPPDEFRLRLWLPRP